MQSPNYTNGVFQNLLPTSIVLEGSSTVKATYDYLTKKNLRSAPREAVPTVKVDLKNLDKSKDIVVWMGHFSVFMQLDGKTVLVDPVFSDYASPVFFVNRAFEGSGVYTASDMPPIDYLLITHDHWDHLDYDSIVALKPRVKKVITGLGVGGYFRQWGFEPDIITEGDWYSKWDMDDDFAIHILPARHFSGRMLTRSQTLWAGFAIQTSKWKIFLSGDSGYGTHFKEIGDMFGGFDLVMLDSGQYDKKWPLVHMNPEEAVQAAVDLRTKMFLPAHIGKFTIANHPWDEPFDRAIAAGHDKDFVLATPLIGEALELGTARTEYTKWWDLIR